MKHFYSHPNDKPCLRPCFVGFLLLLAILFSVDNPISAQREIRHFDVNNGLSNSHVNCFAEDGNGCVWVGTECGLNRFDGRRFQIMSSRSGLLTDESNINALYYDPRSRLLWVSVDNNGFCAINPQTGAIAYENSQIGNISGFAPQGKDQIWISLTYSGIWLYTPARGNHEGEKVLRPLSQLCPKADIPNDCYDIYNDGKGTLYVAHKEHGLSIVHLRTGNTEHYNGGWNARNGWPCARIYQITPDSMGSIWLSSSNGLTRMNLLTRRFTNYFHETGNPSSLLANHTYCSIVTRGKQLWVGSDVGGVSIASNADNNESPLRFQHITPQWGETAIASRNIRSLMQDHYGNIWIGNYGRGIDLVTHIDPPFKTISHTWFDGRNLQPKSIWGLYTDTQDRLWMGGENEISSCNAIADTLRIERSLPLSAWFKRTLASVTTMTEDKAGNMLIGIFDDGLLRYNVRSGSCERIDIGADHVDIYSFFHEKDGAIRIAAENGSWIYDGTPVLKQDRQLNRTMPWLSICKYERDVFGRLWVASYGGGIYVFDRNGRCTHRWGKKQQDIPFYIYDMILDSRQEVWFATDKGLGHIADIRKPLDIRMYKEKDGLAENLARCLAEDADGNIWIGCNRGVSMYDRQRKTFRNYDADHGLPSSASDISVNNVVCLKDGRIVFSSMSGAFYCSPSRLDQPLPCPTLRFISCQSHPDSQNREPSLGSLTTNQSSATYAYDDNDLRVTFSPGDASLTELMDYQYKVEGLDREWVPTGGDNSFTLRNLPPGSYEVKARGRIKGTAWEDGSEASIFVTIAPPWWLSWWAKTLYTLIVATAGFILLIAYKRRLKLRSSLEVERRTHANEQMLNEERIRFYTNVTHELRTPLTLILGPIEDLCSSQALPQNVRQKIEVVHSSAQRLLALVNKLLEFRKSGNNMRQLLVERGNLAEVIRKNGQRFQDANLNTEVRIRCEADDEGLTSVWFDREAVDSIVDNLMGNAIKYTPAGSITLSLHTATAETDGRKWACIQVADTGYGISTEALPHIFKPFYQAKGKHQASGTGIGLALVNELARLHHGTIRVESTEGEGSTFTVMLPLDDDYPDALHKGDSTHRTTASPEAGHPVAGPDESAKKTANILLIVEDNDDIRNYVAESFRPQFQIVEARNGKEGVEKAFETIPDIIVSDVMMPVMDGFELCQTLKQDLRTSHIPIVLLTAKDQLEDRRIGYGCGADSYLTKPFSANLLRTRIDNLLRMRLLLSRYVTSNWQTATPVQAEQMTGDAAAESEAPATGGQTQQTKPEPDAPMLSDLDKDFLERLSAFVKENMLNDDFNTDMAASHMCMSTSTFYRKIKGLTGNGPNQFFRKLKLKHAHTLLTTTQLSVTEAATQSGFNDMRYFRQCFKDEYGINPSEAASKG